MVKEAKNTPVTELFKQFCKERHAEDRGRNHDMLQEVYAKTELFDLSFLPKTTPDMSPFDESEHTYKGEHLKELIFTNTAFKDITLPFESQFIKLGKAGAVDEVCMFVKEYAPFIVTGTSYIKSKGFTLNAPYKIDTELGELRADLKGIYLYANTLRKIGVTEEGVKNAVEAILELTLGQITYVLNIICNLPKHSVACDTPKRAEYYTRRHSSTIKVIKPIYYVLDKKEEKNPVQFKKINPLGHCRFDHSFKVIGHYRRINENSLGKTRNGDRTLKGVTWVKEHVRGEGDLIKKIRIVK